MNEINKNEFYNWVEKNMNTKTIPNNILWLHFWIFEWLCWYTIYLEGFSFYSDFNEDFLFNNNFEFKYRYFVSGIADYIKWDIFLEYFKLFISEFSNYIKWKKEYSNIKYLTFWFDDWDLYRLNI